MLVSFETGLTKEGCMYLFPSVVPSQCLEQWQKYTYAERVAYLHKHASPLIRTGIQVFRTQELQGQAANEDAEASQNETLNLSQIPYSETKVSECLRDESLHPDVCIFMYEDITTPEEMVDATIHLPRTHARAE